LYQTDDDEREKKKKKRMKTKKDFLLSKRQLTNYFHRRSIRKFNNQPRLLDRPIYIYLNAQKPYPSRDALSLTTYVQKKRNVVREVKRGEGFLHCKIDAIISRAA